MMQLGKVLCYGLKQGILVIHLSLPEFVILILYNEGCVLNKCVPFILEDDCTKTSVEWRRSWRFLGVGSVMHIFHQPFTTGTSTTGLESPLPCHRTITSPSLTSLYSKKDCMYAGDSCSKSRGIDSNVGYPNPTSTRCLSPGFVMQVLYNRDNVVVGVPDVATHKINIVV